MSTTPQYPIIRNKSTLAKLLASENITILHEKIPTAMFNLKTRTLFLPLWETASESTYDMLVGHEVGHALWTPAKEWVNGMDFIAKQTGCSTEQAKSYLNIVEDARIERLIKNKFQGLKRDFYLAYEYFVAQEFFGKPSTFPTACFADRLNLHFKLGIHSNVVIPFSSAESQFIPLMERTQSFQNVVDLAVKLIKFCKSQGQNHPVEMENDPSAEQQAGEGEEGEGEEGESSSKESSESKVSRQKPQQQHQQQQLPTPSTNKMMEQAIEKMASTAKTSPMDNHYLCTLPPKHPNVIVTYNMILKDVDLIMASRPNHLELQKVLNPIKVKDYTDASRTMSQAFARKQAADLFHRSSVAKTGALDTLRMNSYRWSDDVFRRTVKIAKGKNHGIIILLDWSGSMQGIMRSTIGQLIILTDFCRRSGIPFEVFAFSDHIWTPNDFNNSSGEDLTTRVEKQYEKDNVKMHPIQLLNWLSSKMTNAEYEKGKSILWNWSEIDNCAKHNQYGLSGTPTTSALVEIVETIEEFKAKNNLQSTHLVVLTDGDSCDGLYLPSDRKNSDGSTRHRHSNIIISDPVTGLKYNIEELDKTLTVQSTSVWIACDIIRKRTGTAIHWIKLHWSKGSPAHQIKGATELPNCNWKRDGFIRCAVDGFDTAIIVDQNRIARFQNGEIAHSAQSMLDTVSDNLNTAKSKTELQKAFIANQSAIGSLKSVATLIGETLGT